MPENPEYYGAEGRLGFFIVQKSVIEAAIAAKDPLPIEPERLECVAPGMARVIRGFDGLEALGILGDRIYMTVEARDGGKMTSFLLCGRYDSTADRVTIDTTKLSPIPLGVDIPNVAEESLLVDGRRILTFSEANGRRCNPAPRAKIFDDEINYVGSIPFPNIEYRVTDATALDDAGRFWVVNYFFPPEAGKLQVDRDGEIDRFGLPDDQDPRHGVERLLELRLTDDDRIERTETPPIWLQRRADGTCRNWEAVVRLDDRGFLLMTDKYPGTLLGYVPNPYRRTATGRSDDERQGALHDPLQPQRDGCR